MREHLERRIAVIKDDLTYLREQLRDTLGGRAYYQERIEIKQYALHELEWALRVIPTMKYQYLDDKNEPLLKCPHCGDSLDGDNGIELHVAINGCELDFLTELDSKGWLVDVDRAVANGYHSSTNCAGCGQMLIDMDGVNEIAILKEST